MARLVKKARPVVSKTKKTPARRVLKPAAGLNPEEVSFLFDRLQAEEKAEKLWSEMVAPQAEEGEAWVAVEEHLLARSEGRDNHERRWKFFGK